LPRIKRPSLVIGFIKQPGNHWVSQHLVRDHIKGRELLTARLGTAARHQSRRVPMQHTGCFFYGRPAAKADYQVIIGPHRPFLS
jgi:hypothetical protein